MDIRTARGLYTESIEQFREAEKVRSFNPDIAEKAIKALDAFLEMTEKLAEIK